MILLKTTAVIAHFEKPSGHNRFAPGCHTTACMNGAKVYIHVKIKIHNTEAGASVNSLHPNVFLSSQATSCISWATPSGFCCPVAWLLVIILCIFRSHTFNSAYVCWLITNSLITVNMHIQLKWEISQRNLWFEASHSMGLMQEHFVIHIIISITFFILRAWVCHVGFNRFT